MGVCRSYIHNIKSKTKLKLTKMSVIKWVNKCVLVYSTKYNEILVSLECLTTKSCPTLCDPMDCNPPGSSLHGIFLARILEWVAMPSSRGFPSPRNWNCVSCLAGRFFTAEPPGKPLIEHYSAIKKEQTVGIPNMGEFQKHYTEWEKTDTKVSTLYDPIYEVLEKKKGIYNDRNILKLMHSF